MNHHAVTKNRTRTRDIGIPSTRPTCARTHAGTLTGTGTGTRAGSDRSYSTVQKLFHLDKAFLFYLKMSDEKSQSNALSVMALPCLAVK
jgi:hypothetical protein